MEKVNAFFEFIEKYKNENPDNLRLRFNNKTLDFDINKAITQIECRKKHSNKLKNFIKPNFIFPDSLSAQQASHQAVALFHNSLLSNYNIILDMTAGLGIDALTFAINKKKVTAIELNEERASVLKFNAQNLGLNNLQVLNHDSIEFLKSKPSSFDIIFVDPSRRSSDNKRVYNLHDCSPDIINNQSLLLKYAANVLIKASPLLDITQTVKDFSCLKSIKVVGVKGECKEILIELDAKIAQTHKDILLESIDLDNNGNIISRFPVIYKPEKKVEDLCFAKLSDIIAGAVILEPSAMLMKLAPWREICQQYNAKKFDNSSHLFVSDEIPDNFPGRVSVLQKIIKKDDRKSLKGFPASVISKNYPLTPEEIRKKLLLAEGDDYFVYASRLSNKPLMLLSKTISR